MSVFRILAFILLAALLAGCSTLSRDGPDDQDVVVNATAAVAAGPDVEKFDYVLVDLSHDVLRNIGPSGAGSIYGTLGAGRGAPPEIQVGVGDVVQVTVFESEAGGLFVPREAGSRPGNYVTFPPQTVDRSGAITVPYAGPIQAAGKSVRDLQREIELKLSNRAIEPQAIVAIVQQRATEISVVGDVNAPSKFALNPAGERVLDAISRAGGIRFPGYETYVTLQRGGRRATVYFKTLIDNPRENVFVAPGDTIYVYREQRSFLAFGASGLNGLFYFESEVVSWAEGVAKAGGLSDDRADPAQTFLYRVVDRRSVEKMGADLSKFPKDRTAIPVIFRANFRQPTMFFLAQKFALQDKDVLYASNSDSVELYKFLGFLNNTTSTMANVPSNLLTAKTATRALAR